MSTMPINFKNAMRYVLLFLDLPGVEGVTRNSYPNCYATWEGIHLHIYEWGTDILRASYHQKNVLLMENHGDADGEPADTSTQQARPRAAVAPPLPAGDFQHERGIDPEPTQVLPKIDVTDPSNLHAAGRPDLAQREEALRRLVPTVSFTETDEELANIPVSRWLSRRPREAVRRDFHQNPRFEPPGNTRPRSISETPRPSGWEKSSAVMEIMTRPDRSQAIVEVLMDPEEEKFQKFLSGSSPVRTDTVRHRKAPLMERLSRKSKKQMKKARVQANRCVVPTVLALSVFMGNGGPILARQ